LTVTFTRKGQEDQMKGWLNGGQKLPLVVKGVPFSLEGGGGREVDRSLANET